MNSSDKKNMYISFWKAGDPTERIPPPAAKNLRGVEGSEQEFRQEHKNK